MTDQPKQYWLSIHWAHEADEPLLVVGPFDAGPATDNAVNKIYAIGPDVPDAENTYAVDLVNVVSSDDFESVLDELVEMQNAS